MNQGNIWENVPDGGRGCNTKRKDPLVEILTSRVKVTSPGFGVIMPANAQ